MVRFAKNSIRFHLQCLHMLSTASSFHLVLDYMKLEGGERNNDHVNRLYNYSKALVYNYSKVLVIELIFFFPFTDVALNLKMGGRSGG